LMSIRNLESFLGVFFDGFATHQKILNRILLSSLKLLPPLASPKKAGEPESFKVSLFLALAARSS
jgi:hypothetical protein